MKKLTLYIIFFLFACVLTSQEKYTLYCSEKLINLSYDSLIAQVGIKEKTGRNDGEVLKYQKPFGLKNLPYCAMAQYWVFSVNERDKNLIPLFKTAVAQKHFEYAVKKGLKTAYKAHKHDLIVWRYKSTQYGHIERIVKVLNYGYVLTIGFNTSNGKTGSQREGNGVFYRKRNIYEPTGRLFILGLIGIEKNKQYKSGCNYE